MPTFVDFDLVREAFIDAKARELYDIRSEAPVHLTDEQWQRVKETSRTTVIMLRLEVENRLEEDLFEGNEGTDSYATQLVDRWVAATD